MTKLEEESLRFTYDVFLSFRGEDTRHKFIGHLRKELSRKGINTFFDDKNLRIGEGISPALSSAIEESKILIIVFSENYASSTWCLDELVKILESTKIIWDKKQLVFPIFYHVDPSDIRHQRNKYAEAMIAHENKFGKDSQKVQAWRSALSEACNLPGQHITTGYETEFIEEIVEKVYKSIAPKPLYTGQNPVGLGPRIEEVKSLLNMKPNDNTVRMLGIHGLGGVGKTELAKALYDNIVHHFDAASFLADVREKSNKIKGMENLQKTLLSKMSEELENELGSTSKGIYEIKRKLHRKKVLLVLDDVVDKDSLEKLAGGCDWFGSGSRIIITTRDKDVLTAHQVENIYEMKELDEQHSLELFCWNAFKQSHPKTSFEDVSLRAVDFAKRLPLALKVIGSDLSTLHEETLEAWEGALEEYERIPPNKRIQDVLKISYDRLGDNAKKIFLDIACFFKEEKIEYVKKILEEFGTTTNINLLVNKSLLTIENGCLKMHDLIQDVGREIVAQDAPNPGELSRLWYYEDVMEILTEDFGSDKIQGIMLDPPQRERVCWRGTAFKKMNWLRILIVRNTSFTSEPEHLPNHLRLLDWEEYPSKSFPSKFHPKKIVVFNLPRSHLTLEGSSFKNFPCLTNMDFSYNHSIKEIPDVSHVQNLRELRLDHCRNLFAVHESVGFLKRLAHLSLSECTQLRNFLPTMFLPSLEVLDLNLCVSLEHFPEIMNEMNKPLKIYMINTAIQELTESIGYLTGLVCIDISNSRKLKYLPSSLFMLPNVVSFKIEGCSQLRESFRNFMQSPLKANVRPTLRTLYFGNGNLLDEDLGAILFCFPKLEELIASENNFVSLPSRIKECDHLTSLDVNGCKKLQKIPECINLRILIVHGCCNLEEIAELPSSIQKVDARYCFKLTRETSDMLWFQVEKGIRGIEVVMPTTEFPKWFNFVDDGGSPHFWARGKFPNIALAMVFQFQDESERDKLARRRLVDLRLVINGQYVPCKGHYNFRIDGDHVLICDLRRLLSEKEWLGLDAFLKHEWNVVQVSYEATSTLMISHWGAFVYEQGTNMEDVQFVCPDPKYSDMPSTIVPPVKKDVKQQLVNEIEKLALDLTFKKTLMEWMDNQERGGSALDPYTMHILLGELKKLSEQAEDALNPKGASSALEDPNSYLRWLLDSMKNDDGKPKVLIKGDLALIRLKDEVDIHSHLVELGRVAGADHHVEEQGYDPQQEELIREMFYEGMTDGLLEAQKSFPSLDIIKIRNAALNKGNRVACSLQEPQGDQGNLLLPPLEVKIYIEGIINGLREAKLSFPYLDVWATLNALLSRKGMNEFFVSPLPHSVPDNRLVEALRNTFVLDKDSDTKAPVMDDVGKASTSGHQGSEEEIMKKIFYDGMTDGLVEARNIYPSLDIDKTRSAALNKGNNSHRIAWPLSGPPGYPPPSDEMKMYVEGIRNGLHEAKLTFPDLDGRAIFRTVFMRTSLVSLALPPPSVPQFDWSKVIPPPASHDRLLQTFMMMTNQPSLESEVKSKFFWKLKEEHQALRNKFLQLENQNGAPDHKDTASSWKNQYHELIQKFNTDQSGQSVSSKLDCTYDLKYASKLGDVLKGRAEELGRLYDAGTEGFQNSEELQDLMSAIYLNGLLEAQILLAVFKENEERVIDEVAHDENPVVADFPSPTAPHVDNPHPDTNNHSDFNWLEFV